MNWLTRAKDFLRRSDGSLQQKALRSGFWVGLSGVLGAGLSFVRSVVLARLLMPEAFGLMAICSMVIQGIEIFTETGFGAALIHRQQRFEEARDTAFTLWVLRGMGLAFIAVCLSPWVGTFYGQEVLTSMVPVIGMSFIITGFRNVNMIALQKELDFKRLIYVELISAVLNTIISIGLAYRLGSVWALVYAQLAAAIISVGLSYALVPGRPRFCLDRAIAKELFAYGKFMTALAVVVYIGNQLDTATIGKVLGMEALGYYSLAYTLANLPSTNLSKIVAKVLFPMFSKLQSDVPQLRREYARGVRLLATVVVPVSLGIVVLADDIVLVLYGAKWAPAAMPLRVLAVFGCFQALWMLNGYLFNAIGKPHVDFYANASRLIIVLVLLYPCTIAFGILGTSLAVTIPMACQFAVGLYLSRQVIGVPLVDTMWPLATAVFQGGIMAVVLWGAKSVVPSDSLLGLGVLGLIGAAVAILFNHKDLRMHLKNSRLSPVSIRQTS